MRKVYDHPYHGITYHSNGYGWHVQIKLLGQYQQIRANVSTAEQAARRHDIALAVLEAFTPPTLTPNFPDDFADIPFSPALDTLSRDEKEFRVDVVRWRDQLTAQLERAGVDVVDKEIQRNRARESVNRKGAAEAKNFRFKTLAKLSKIQMDLHRFSLPKASANRAELLLRDLIALLEQGDD